MELAPIILFAYNRPWHTRQTLMALQKNELADQSILYIYADGLKDGASPESDKAVKDTRAVLFEEKWCKEVHVIERDSNFGLAANVIDGVTSVVNRYNKIIVLEDDLVTSPFFLTFCNEGLELYKNKKNVFSINGFQFPIEIEKTETFLSPLATSSWGWATWKDRWMQLEKDSINSEILKNNSHLRQRFNLADYNFVSILENRNSWAIRWYYTVFLRSGLGVFPTKSLVYNIGFDNSGENCGPVLYNQKIYQKKIPINLETRINLKYYSLVLEFFSNNISDSNTHIISLPKIISKIFKKLR